MSGPDIRTYEVTFCSRVAGWANALFARHPEWPFRRAEIEESKAIHRKRSDLRFYGDARKLILSGEVKMRARAMAAARTIPIWCRTLPSRPTMPPPSSSLLGTSMR